MDRDYIDCDEKEKPLGLIERIIYAKRRADRMTEIELIQEYKEVADVRHRLCTPESNEIQNEDLYDVMIDIDI